MPMTEEQLLAIRERVAKATPGPWEVELSATWDDDAHYSIRTHDNLPEHPWSPRYIAWLSGTVAHLRPGDDPRRILCETCGMFLRHHRALAMGVDIRGDEQIAADAELMAHAPTDLTALLSEVDQLQALVQHPFREHGTGKQMTMLDGLSQLFERINSDEQRIMELEAENIVAREIVSRVASSQLRFFSIDRIIDCEYCHAQIDGDEVIAAGGVYPHWQEVAQKLMRHREDCIVLKSRVLLGLEALPDARP